MNSAIGSELELLVCLRSRKLGLEAGLIGMVWKHTSRFGLEAGQIGLVWEQTGRFGMGVD